MPIKVSTMVPQTKYLKLSDPSGKTYVVINPPDYQAVMERDELLKNRTLMPGVGTQVSSNISQSRCTPAAVTAKTNAVRRSR